MTAAKKLQSTLANAGGEATYVDDVFSTYLYQGSSSTQTITNDINLADEGGMVWCKGRSSSGYSHRLFDTARGANESLSTNSTSGEQTQTNSVTSFNTDGFTLGSDGNGEVNYSGSTYASWTFRKAPGFFDVVTYTATGTAGQTVPHNLGCVPGMIIVKEYTDANNWAVYHKGVDATAPEDYILFLDSTGARSNSAGYWNDTAPTATEFTIGSNIDVNETGNSYVAYLFADGDDAAAQIFGTDGDQAVIKCGSYTGNSSTDGVEIDCGFEPQWVLVKASDVSADWFLFDAMRGVIDGTGGDQKLLPNSSAAEAADTALKFTPTGFKFETSSANYNSSSYNYIYIAIRRPHKPAETGSEVFAVGTQGEDSTSKYGYTSGFPVDFAWRTMTTGESPYSSSRLTGRSYLVMSGGGYEAASTYPVFDDMESWWSLTSTDTGRYSHMFKRSPGFFDVVTYKGNQSSGRTISHNLGVAPEMMIVKDRDYGSSWWVYHTGINVDGDNAPETDVIRLNMNIAPYDDATIWNDTAPTDAVFTLGWGNSNANNYQYVAYLFASQTGISKVGSYTGNGTSQTIDCGFTTGARFALIRRSDSTGDWVYWDYKRGIVSGSEYSSKINGTGSYVTSDSIDPDSSGFVINQDSSTNANISGATYIYLAIA